MGADMIGYMIAGPAKIEDADLITKARDNARHVVKTLQDMLESDFDPPTRKPLRGSTETLDDRVLRIVVGDTSVEHGYFSGFNLDEFVTEFVEFWNRPDSRDAAYRMVGEHKVVFAGDRSWGDEPDGYGYRMLRDADTLGLTDDLGLF
jgi:hypothetical protein